MNTSEFIVFVDESGDHGLGTIDPQFPVFVLAFCIVAKPAYSRMLLPAITDFKFVPKSANVPGLQIADLVARPIARHIMNASQPNRAYAVIEKKLDRSPSGSVLGWGLKVFP